MIFAGGTSCHVLCCPWTRPNKAISFGFVFDKKKKKAPVVGKKKNYFYCSKSGYFYLLDDQNQTYWDPLKWKMYVDERDELYYSSEVTGETVWELP